MNTESARPVLTLMSSYAVVAASLPLSLYTSILPGTQISPFTSFGNWYIIGFCHLRQGVRTFGIDRVRSIKIVNDHFKYPAEFDLEEYLERGWSLQADAEQEEIALRFDKSIAPWIAGCKFHPNQKITVQPDGNALFEVTVAGVDEIKHWILSFGDKVEVLKPDTLRLSIANTCRNMAQRYVSYMDIDLVGLDGDLPSSINDPSFEYELKTKG